MDVARAMRRSIGGIRRALIDARIRRNRSDVRLIARSMATSHVRGPPAFDAERAWELLLAQCDMGPRAPGTVGHDRAREWMVERLAEACEQVAVQQWSQCVARGVGRGITFDMCNVIGRIHGTAPDGKELMLSTHWDTRPVADQDPDPARRADPVPGANDGASGVAVLLELARALSARRPERSVVFAFWDGEDLGEYCYGSRLFADSITLPEYRSWRASDGVVVDMVGGRGFRCMTESNSLRFNPDLWARLQQVASALDVEEFRGGATWTITDDHVFLSRAGIPTVLLIDRSYVYWHTTNDVPANCDPASLGAVGRVLERLARGDARHMIDRLEPDGTLDATNTMGSAP